MGFAECIRTNDRILMEGALGERLKREYGLCFDEHVAMAGLIYQQEGAFALSRLWGQYIDIARSYQLPFLATTPTRRAGRDRVRESRFEAHIIKDNVDFLRRIQQESGIEMYAGGLMGCKGDAYTGEGALTMEEARAYHSWQAELFRKAEADFLYAGIMPTLPEAAGMAQAMSDTGLPYIISFTIQRDGRLIDGTPIAEAIVRIDSIVENAPVCYMTNCVHPTIVYEALSQPFNCCDVVRERFWGVQANTSPLSYAELDNAKELFCSEPDVFAEHMMELRKISGMRIFGGCCGTDDRHMKEVADRLSACR